MGWLDKLLGRDKQDVREPAGASASGETGAGSATAPADPDPHEGHGHPPGAHPEDEQT
jgi:hypothetical protein